MFILMLVCLLATNSLKAVSISTVLEIFLLTNIHNTLLHIIFVSWSVSATACQRLHDPNHWPHHRNIANAHTGWR